MNKWTFFLNWLKKFSSLTSGDLMVPKYFRKYLTNEIKKFRVVSLESWKFIFCHILKTYPFSDHSIRIINILSFACGIKHWLLALIRNTKSFYLWSRSVLQACLKIKNILIYFDCNFPISQGSFRCAVYIQSFPHDFERQARDECQHILTALSPYIGRNGISVYAVSTNTGSCYIFILICSRHSIHSIGKYMWLPVKCWQKEFGTIASLCFKRFINAW